MGKYKMQDNLNERELTQLFKGILQEEKEKVDVAKKEVGLGEVNIPGKFHKKLLTVEYLSCVNNLLNVHYAFPEVFKDGVNYSQEKYDIVTSCLVETERQIRGFVCSYLADLE